MPRPQPTSASRVQRLSQGSLLLGGGLLIGAGVLIGSFVAPALRPRPPVEEPQRAPDPPAVRRQREPNYELLRSSDGTVGSANVTSHPTPDAEVRRPLPPETKLDVEPKPRPDTKAEPRPELKPEVKAQPKPEVKPGPELAEAQALLAAIDALKKAPDGELRTRVSGLRALESTDARVVAARDRCAAAYQSLVDGLERVERVTSEVEERERTGRGRDAQALRAELEAADAAAGTAKRGVLACEAGLARLRAAFQQR